MRHENEYPVTELGGQAVTNLAMIEEMRLMCSKFNRMYSELLGAIGAAETVIDVMKLGEKAACALVKDARRKVKRQRERAKLLPKKKPKRKGLFW